MLTAIRSSPAIKAKERIVSWVLLSLHVLVVFISVQLLLSPNSLFNRSNGFAAVNLNVTLLLRTSSLGSISSSNLTALLP